MKLNEIVAYAETLDSRPKGFQTVQSDIKELVFDYFNIIPKEYEMAYEKHRSDKQYQEEITAIKTQVDTDFVEKKFDELPANLTREKTEEIVKRKQEIVNSALMSMIKG